MTAFYSIVKKENNDMDKIELLSPAGNYECFLAAINAGADAVYLAGKEFGARAYAGNFEEDEILNALHYAHIHQKKIYLTCNTLIKEKEWHLLYPFLEKMYCHGLDGIIIQDIGLLSFLKENFPLLDIHISTQMTVTDSKSVNMLYELGAKRIVPARELSLKELKEITNFIPIELETFAHGALCYCYSGQCLFSSFLGKRSGNRGKCAQPCRLPYQINGRECYPLSLKDLCTIDILGELIEAGIKSLKIEGRMKSAQYVAGVTSIYRKYIDEYYNANQCAAVSKEDHEFLNHLYIRSQSDIGYYKTYNGKNMVTLKTPSYLPVNESINEMLTEKYCTTTKKMPIDGSITLERGKKAFLKVSCQDISIFVQGEFVSDAINKPISKEDVVKQITKTGNSFFEFKDLTVNLESGSFMTIKQLNELRREALDSLQNEMLTNTFRKLPDQTYTRKDEPAKKDSSMEPKLHISITDKEQLTEVLSMSFCSRIYLPADMLVNKIITQDSLKMSEKQEIFLILPRIIRKKDDNYLKILQEILNDTCIDGVLVQNLEEVYWLKQIEYCGKKALNHTLYSWNKESLSFYSAYADSVCAPLELSRKEINDLSSKELEIVAFGHLPMMVTANCMNKTMNECNHQKKDGFIMPLKDRYQKSHPIYGCCTHCYNEIFNAIPLSLHKEIPSYLSDGYHIFRLDFTIEDRNTVKRISDCYYNIINGKSDTSFFAFDYTTGHSQKGAL